MTSTPKIRFLRNSNLGERPVPEDLVSGQPAINTNSSSFGMFFADSDGDLVKIGPTGVGLEPPTETPCLGESWLQPSNPGQDSPIFWVFDGVNWAGVELGLVYEPPQPPA